MSTSPVNHQYRVISFPPLPTHFAHTLLVANPLTPLAHSHTHSPPSGNIRRGCQQWVNYFLHAGHLSIEGLKMSKSLKNFISIK